MTSLEQYHKILKSCLRCTDEDLNDEKLAYLRYKKWDSVTHIDMVAELEEAFGITFGTLDITGFNTYSKGIEILKEHGVDFS